MGSSIQNVRNDPRGPHPAPDRTRPRRGDAEGMTLSELISETLRLSGELGSGARIADFPNLPKITCQITLTQSELFPHISCNANLQINCKRPYQCYVIFLLSVAPQAKILRFLRCFTTDFALKTTFSKANALHNPPNFLRSRSQILRKQGGLKQGG